MDGIGRDAEVVEMIFDHIRHTEAAAGVR
jgi:hypothetical protein